MRSRRGGVEICSTGAERGLSRASHPPPIPGLVISQCQYRSLSEVYRPGVAVVLKSTTKIVFQAVVTPMMSFGVKLPNFSQEPKRSLIRSFSPNEIWKTTPPTITAKIEADTQVLAALAVGRSRSNGECKILLTQRIWISVPSASKVHWSFARFVLVNLRESGPSLQLSRSISSVAEMV